MRLIAVSALGFAGGTVVHINAAVAGLVGAFVIGKRTGYGKEAMAPHSLTLTMVGAALLYERLRLAQSTLGQAVSPEDCFLVLRGLETLKIRHETQARSALRVATMLAEQPEVHSVLYPPLPQSPGHALWTRDFQGAGCVLSFVPRAWSDATTEDFFSALRVFAIGASWGGVHSLAALYPEAEQRARHQPCIQSALIRLSVGLEDPEQLLDDLRGAFMAARAAKGEC